MYGDLEEVIYITQPKQYIGNGKESSDVCKLTKSLYDLKQSPRIFQQKVDYFVLSLRFLRSKLDHHVYYKQDGRHFLFITLYVYDMLFLGNNKDVISDLKSQVSTQFFTKDFGDAKYILGIEIRRDRTNWKLWLGQSKYVKSVLQHFRMVDCRPLSIHIYVGTKISIEQCPTTSIPDQTLPKQCDS